MTFDQNFRFHIYRQDHIFVLYMASRHVNDKTLSILSSSYLVSCLAVGREVDRGCFIDTDIQTKVWQCQHFVSLSKILSAVLQLA